MPENIYYIGVNKFDLPDDKLEGFLSRHPDAIKSNRFIVNQDTFDVPIDKIEGFKTRHTEAVLSDSEPTATELAEQLQEMIPTGTPLTTIKESFNKLREMKKEGRLDIFTDQLRKELEDKPVASAFLSGVFGEHVDIGQELPEAKTVGEKFARAGAGLAGTVISFAPVGKAVRAMGVGGRLIGKHRLAGKIIGAAETFLLNGQLLSKRTDYVERLKIA